MAKTLSQEIKTDYMEVTDLTDRMGPLNYLKSTFDAMRENKTLIKTEIVELGDYDLIYIGSPTCAAPAITTLIDQCDLQNKDVIYLPP